MYFELFMKWLSTLFEFTFNSPLIFSLPFLSISILFLIEDFLFAEAHTFISIRDRSFSRPKANSFLNLTDFVAVTENTEFYSYSHSRLKILWISRYHFDSSLQRSTHIVSSLRGILIAFVSWKGWLEMIYVFRSYSRLLFQFLLRCAQHPRVDWKAIKESTRIEGKCDAGNSSGNLREIFLRSVRTEESPLYTSQECECEGW